MLQGAHRKRKLCTVRIQVNKGHIRMVPPPPKGAPAADQELVLSIF